MPTVPFQVSFESERRSAHKPGTLQTGTSRPPRQTVRLLRMLIHLAPQVVPCLSHALKTHHMAFQGQFMKQKDAVNKTKTDKFVSYCLKIHIFHTFFNIFY